MMVLIVGGSGSGKSAYAEDCIVSLSGGCRKYYLATLQVYDREGQAKIERHRMLRSGKGFITIEQPTDIQAALGKMDDGTAVSAPGVDEAVPGRTALLECMSNLTANEMFSGEVPQSCEAVTDKIIAGIEKLNRGLRHLVIVTNNVFEDGIVYDETTMEYIQALGLINERLASMADEVVEVVVGIPLLIKGGK